MRLTLVISPHILTYWHPLNKNSSDDMSAHESGRVPLPEVARSLSPYINTRQEALQIRRTLTVYLTSLLKDEDTPNRSPLSLTIPDADIQVPEIPLEASGVSKEYLREVQAHLKARREYRAVAVRGQDHPFSNSYISRLPKEIPAGDVADTSSVHAYLALLRQRRRYERLRILKDYVDVLVTKPASKMGYLDIAKVHLDELPVPPLHQPAGRMVSSRSSNGSENELVLHLEKAVLRAKHKLDNEQKLLTSLKARHYSGRGVDGTEQFPAFNRDGRGNALHHTRQELIAWVEQELAKTDGAPDTSLHQLGTSDMPQSAMRDTEQSLQDIDSHYGGYTEARKICLATVARATSFVPLRISEEHPVPTSHLAKQPETVTDACCSGLLDSYMRLLIPLSLHRLVSQQKAYIASALTKEQEATIQVLDRLADESHLLPGYPLLATDSRFRNITAALGSKISPIHLDARSGSVTQTRAIEMASRWAFAASAAKGFAHDALEEKIVQGTEHMDTAREILSEVRNLLGQRPQPAGTFKKSQMEEEDIWASRTAARARKGNDIPKVDNKDTPKTIWYRLRGDLT